MNPKLFERIDYVYQHRNEMGLDDQQIRVVEKYHQDFIRSGAGLPAEKLEVVEMIAGYTHNLINLSDTEDMVTVIWANACFDPNRPDTYFDPVE